MFLKLIKTSTPLEKPFAGFTAVVRQREEYHWWENLLVWINQKTMLCSYCGKKRATWCYMPSWYCACDECVPRGCSCNQDENGVDELDYDGQKMPCCEWWRTDYGLKKHGLHPIIGS